MGAGKVAPAPTLVPLCSWTGVRLGLGVPAGVHVPRTLHGVRNHLDLHNPVEFDAEYAEPGAFAVRVGQTSGYGGSALIVTVDGVEALRKDFPGQTQTVLTQYQGYYAVPVTAGRHTIRVDNDGADWLEVEAYRFDNYGRGSVTVAREDAAVTVSVLDAQAKPLRGLEAEGLSVRAHKDHALPIMTARTLAKVEVVGQDRPGIVRRISQVLAQQQVNVEELVTHCESAPMSGEKMFHAAAMVHLPESCTLGQLRHALELIAADLMVDVAVMPARNS